MAWVLVCVPSGALAGAGLVEFDWGGPPYDGGFMGDLVFFGGFLALGQAPFVAVFAWFSLRRAGGRPWRRYFVAVVVAVLWPVVGFVGWTFGSFVDPCISGCALYAYWPNVLGRSLRWLVVGAAEGAILAVATTILPAFDPPGDGSWSTRTIWRTVAAPFGLCAASWVSASAVGGLLVEGWSALDVAARTNGLNEAIGAYLFYNLGFAENVAYIVVPRALFVPVLYGIPTGLVFLAVYRGLRRAT